MAMWPFRRKSGRKRSRIGATMTDLDRAPPRAQTGDPASGGVTRRPSQRKARMSTEPNKLRRRTYSFSPGRRDSIRAARGSKTKKRDDAVPPVPGLPADSILAGKNDDEKGGTWTWERVPTLHNKREGQDVPRRKSSKRRREDLDREAEIKAMSDFVPLRPPADHWTAGRPMKKDSKRIRTGFGFGKSLEIHSSEISIPVPESIHSSMSSDSEFGSYKIGALEALAPRPTLRFAGVPRWASPSGGSGPTRTSSQRRKFFDRASIPEATLRAHKRIDDLADDLDASGLRELMERDKRRRELKREREQERMERRLARRAEKQREAEDDSALQQLNLERGVMGREMVGLGIDTTSAVVTSTKRRSSDASPKQLSKMPEGAVIDETEEPQVKPLDHFHRMDSIPVETPAKENIEASEDEHGPAPPLPVISPKRALLKKKSPSQSTLPEEEPEKPLVSPPPGKTEETDAPRKSDGSSKGRLSFTSLFKWPGNRKRGSGQSSFANTSREEMQAAALPTLPPMAPIAVPVVPIGQPVRTLSSGVPRRTMSRFREDLPELPLSPPDSRIQSPEAEPRPEREEDPHQPSTPIPMRFDTPTSGHRSMDEAMQRTPTSWHHGGAQHSPEPQQSISLASIDSEASWLSGRLAARRSANMRESLTRQPQHEGAHSYSSASNNTEEDIAENDYFTPGLSPPAQAHSRELTGEARSSDDDEPMPDADLKWGSVGARRTALMVHADQHTTDRVKSREGLVNVSDEEEGSDMEPEAEGEGEGDENIEEGGLQRATSVKLKDAHARHISAGSAKLLDLSPRASTDQQHRLSEGRRSSGIAFL